MPKKYSPSQQTRSAGEVIAGLIEQAEQTAHRHGFHFSASALNNAKNALGWEMAGELDHAAKAARGERPTK